MIYIFESELPDNKSIKFSLCYVFGIGRIKSSLICKKLGFCINLKAKKLKNSHLTLLSQVVENLKILIMDDLKKKIALDNSRLLFIQSYRGLRKECGLPVRGQRTHTNAKTARKKF